MFEKFCRKLEKLKKNILAKIKRNFEELSLFIAEFQKIIKIVEMTQIYALLRTNEI